MKLAVRLRKIRSTFRRLTVRLRKKRTRRILLILFCALFIISTAYRLVTENTSMNPAAYQPLLQVIAKGESEGNYNARFGDASNTEIQFTKMSLQEVMDWQSQQVGAGAASNAVGKYQIIGPTLRGLVRQLGIDPKERFDEAMQDRLARALIDRRGAADFAKGKLSADQFANNLSMEWASLPTLHGPNAGQSYYQGDGLNAAHVTQDEVLAAVEQFRRSL